MVDKLRFKDENGFDYPEWKEKKLGELYDKGKSGGTPKSTNYLYYDGNIPFLSISDMTEQGKYIIKTAKTITDEGLNNSGAWLVPKNSLIYSIYASVGLVGINKIELATSQAMYAMVLKKYINTDYMYYCLSFFRSNGLKRIIESGTQGNINSNSLNNINIPLPSPEEQQKIADFLSTVDDKIENQKEIVKNLEEIKKGLIQKIFSKEIRFKDDNGLDYPKWEEKKLNEIALIKKGMQLNKTNFISTGKYYVLNGGIEPSGFYDEYNTKANTISISEGGNSCGYVNFNKANFWSGGHNYTLEIKNNCINYYLYNYLKFKEKSLMELRVGGGLPNIQKTDLEKVIIKIPCTQEQQKIADFLLNVDEKIYKEKNILNDWIDVKKGLLQRMF